MGRTIIIGDIHGCLKELGDLLAALSVSGGDRLISVGDLVGKGPDPAGVLRWAMEEPRLSVVLGNHEHRILSLWQHGPTEITKAGDHRTSAHLAEIRPEAESFLRSLPLYLRIPGACVVHAGIDPAAGPAEEQRAETLLTVRRLPGELPWYESYHGQELIVFGHWSRPEPVWRENAVGLDTGCVYGGRLTALVLPERRLVSVPARERYCTKKNWPTPHAGGLLA